MHRDASYYPEDESNYGEADSRGSSVAGDRPVRPVKPVKRKKAKPRGGGAAQPKAVRPERVTVAGLGTLTTADGLEAFLL